MNIQFTYNIICNQHCLFSSEKIDSPLAFIVVPGNPSIIEFYKEFSCALIELFNYPTIIVSLCKNGEHSLGVHQAIHLKIQFFNEIFQKYPNTKFIILGHSIGNYITLQALRQIDQSRIVGYYGLFPALINLKQSFCTLYKIITYSPFIIACLAFSTHLLQLLPLSLITFFFSLVTDVPKQYIPILKHHLDPQMTGQMLSLCKDEGIQIKEYPDDFIQFLNSFHSKLHLIYGKNDVYGNENVARDMMQRCPEAQITITDILHAFVLGYVQNVIEVISPMLKETIQLFEHQMIEE
ncbi:hypothetical protein ENUP19_0361G0005 [Entamoeba nuttalli]|uniref:Lipid droplet-associated hydrolase n=2 Tax=Entamoeba nuttalli TaxID=412467 RepID=K2HG35_ENTNP|nr:hypothetical protein ENU1_043400 [Entamoeba nuttalli P19]EKE41829.1 hypothetical protein ENU1_043400 [Entamoeba nuttalli P19]|eukprot:XP_008855838.1 hypothetical protein ENU1_043400 [Entamoeba nuttalli P19]